MAEMLQGGGLSSDRAQLSEPGWASLTLFNVTIRHQATFKPAIPLVVEWLLFPAHSILLPGNTIQVEGPRVSR